MDELEEEFIPEDEEGTGPGALKKLREKLAKAVEEKQEYLEGWQRSRADFANYKSQEASLLVGKEGSLKAELIEALIPALDTLELSLKHHPDDKNLQMIEKQFLNSLQQVGVERFGAKGDDFNPHEHEALAMQGDEHIIQSVERSGYKIGNKIIRPAQVII